MSRFGYAKLWLAVVTLAAPAYAQQACAVSKDLVVRALEMVSATPSRDQLGDGLLLLKQAEESCDENGDAWYYRSLFERKLGQGNPQYSLGKARERSSTALRSEDDPFHLATPARGVQAAPVENSAGGGAPHSARDSRKPGYGRLEVVPPPDAPKPAPAPNFNRSWSSQSAPGPVTDYPPYPAPPIVYAPTVEPNQKRQGQGQHDHHP